MMANWNEVAFIVGLFIIAMVILLKLAELI